MPFFLQGIGFGRSIAHHRERAGGHFQGLACPRGWVERAFYFNRNPGRHGVQGFFRRRIQRRRSIEGALHALEARAVVYFDEY